MTDEESRLRRHFSRLLRRFQTAAIDMSWQGSKDKNEHAGIEQEYLAAHQAIHSFTIDLIKAQIKK